MGIIQESTPRRKRSSNEPIVFLDRDGVINEWIPDGYVTHWEMWRFRDQSLEALKLLKRYNIPVIVITNQSVVGRGYIDLAALRSIHDRFLAEVFANGGAVLDIFYCPHAPWDNCDCRKPKPKLFLDAVLKYQWLDLTKSWFIGDKETDLLAAKNAGCKGLLLNDDDNLLNLVKSFILPDFNKELDEKDNT